MNLACLVLVVIFAVGVHSNCGCLKCNPGLRVCSPPGSPVKIIIREANQCTCPINLPYSLQVPVVPPPPPCYRGCYKYGIELPDEVPDDSPYIRELGYQVQVPAPQQPPSNFLMGLVAKTDRIVLPAPPEPDCPPEEPEPDCSCGYSRYSEIPPSIYLNTFPTSCDRQFTLSESGSPPFELQTFPYYLRFASKPSPASFLNFWLPQILVKEEPKKKQNTNTDFVKFSSSDNVLIFDVDSTDAKPRNERTRRKRSINFDLLNRKLGATAPDLSNAPILKLQKAQPTSKLLQLFESIKAKRLAARKSSLFTKNTILKALSAPMKPASSPKNSWPILEDVVPSHDGCEEPQKPKKWWEGHENVKRSWWEENKQEGFPWLVETQDEEGHSILNKAGEERHPLGNLLNKYFGRHKREIRFGNYKDMDGNDLMETVAARRKVLPKQKSRDPFTEPFVFDEILGRVPILYLLNAPAKYLNHLHRLKSHVTPIMGTIPTAIRVSRELLRNLVRNFGKNFLNLGLIPRKPMSLTRKRLRRSPRDFPKEHTRESDFSSETRARDDNARSDSSEENVRFVNEGSRHQEKPQDFLNFSEDDENSSFLSSSGEEASEERSPKIHNKEHSRDSSARKSSFHPEDERQETSERHYEEDQGPRRRNSRLREQEEPEESRSHRVFGPDVSGSIQKIPKKYRDLVESPRKLKLRRGNLRKSLRSSQDSSEIDEQPESAPHQHRSRQRRHASDSHSTVLVKYAKCVLDSVMNDMFNLFLNHNVTKANKSESLQRVPHLKIPQEVTTMSEATEPPTTPTPDGLELFRNEIQQIRRTLNDSEPPASIETQTIKEEINEILNDLNVLLKEGATLGDDRSIPAVLHELQSVKTATTSKLRDFTKESSPETKEAIQTQFKTMKELRHVLLRGILAKLDGENRFGSSSWIKLLVRLQKLHCIMNRLREELQYEDLELDLDRIDSLTSVIEKINFAAPDEEDERIGRVKKELRLLKNLADILNGNYDDIVKSEAKILWEIRNLEKLQRESIEELKVKVSKGLRIRRELKILFDLQKHFRKCDERQKGLMEQKIASAAATSVTMVA